ncbi:MULTISPECIES: CinA family protein [unclassified Streptomyces]|uniref:CinA family protein n=1 Tax=unclassified Streptomyces TaxID=2593676 RepID=UPI0022B62608|nr:MULTISPECIES: nicotinamide-nucleotide amidohydrolase family protein [unclassified Streptomyces]MCZ7416167.1 nicotinamide-nucleotide amidohydrolase family protein [Streptomyces sp. WMMC897]MCZ7434025.1 nicotinamide-nucleotide amidohydrolase family protein [Streptomyces sp. WMMC1477]
MSPAASGADSGFLAAEALRLLRGRGETVGVAESLTGGLVAAALTAVPGASRSVRGSLTAYATDVKQRLLGVDGELLSARGAVHPEVARQMAGGVRALLGTRWGVATTGVAGPEPQDGQPVGTVYVAVAGPTGPVTARRLALTGDRTRIREESVRAVLHLLCGELLENGGGQDTEQSGGQGCLQP